MSRLISAFVDRLSVQVTRRKIEKSANKNPVAKSTTLAVPLRSSQIEPHRPAPDHRLRESHL